MITATIRSRSAFARDRLDAHFFTSPGVEASERLALLEARGLRTAQIGGLGRVWAPSRFARAYAAPSEPGVPYLRPYDVFDYLPASEVRLSLDRNEDLDRLVPAAGTLLQTCSGRNLGPCTIADEHLSRFALSHDMVRIEVDDEPLRLYVLAFLKTTTGQALLRRGKSGSVIDHLTVADIASVPVALVDPATFSEVVGWMRTAVAAMTEARSRLAALLQKQDMDLPLPRRNQPAREGWTLRSSTVRDRLDAAFYDPLVADARAQVKDRGGIRCSEIAKAHLPVRYKRFYVGPTHGRPILSGRQILQLEPINLRWVSDRSFRDPGSYVVSAGASFKT